ncbi:tumor necrosis factor receptor superfamily member 26-like isoform X2 [Meriones unguiculatus]|uniref:tumor necrosis factor receptor superfamily member 26-like isoform X2 n=1 Tax=Meriones unguiculatus TaxID=10047 RepID=UPI00293EAB3A|nr:tumor necrosis factor receptor superfamily member 26-like isoform X2 [Meriones unguiculatus]
MRIKCTSEINKHETVQINKHETKRSLGRQPQFGSPAFCKSQVTVCSVSEPSQCGEGEFKSENLCCRLCPAGTYLREPCQRNHGESDCPPCETEHFTAYKNRESQCLRCARCWKGQEEVSKCSKNADRKCQCKQGTYCNSEHCEVCSACTSCPNGTVRSQCNATMDTVCDTNNSKPGMSCYQSPCFAELWTIMVASDAAIIVVFAIISAIIWYCYKRGKTVPRSVNSSNSPSTML